jgi:hypothetical protein
VVRIVERKDRIRYPEKLIERGDDVALASTEPSPAEMLSGLSHCPYRLSIDTPIDFWETKLMPRMRCRTRSWQLIST